MVLTSSFKLNKTYDIQPQKCKTKMQNITYTVKNKKQKNVAPSTGRVELFCHFLGATVEQWLAQHTLLARLEVVGKVNSEN